MGFSEERCGTHHMCSVYKVHLGMACTFTTDWEWGFPSRRDISRHFGEFL